MSDLTSNEYIKSNTTSTSNMTEINKKLDELKPPAYDSYRNDVLDEAIKAASQVLTLADLYHVTKAIKNLKKKQ